MGRFRQLAIMICVFTCGVICAVLTNSAIGWLQPSARAAVAPTNYAVYAISEDGKQLAPGIAGIISLNATGLQTALNDISANGYRLHSVVSDGESGGWVVIVEQ